MTADNAANSASVLLGNGDGTFKARVSFATGVQPLAVTIADVNGDGVLDLLTADSGDNTSSVLLGNGDGTFQARQSFAAGAQPASIVTADINGDGALDLLAADFGGSTVSVLLGNGTSTNISFTPLGGISVKTRGEALTAQDKIDTYLGEVSLVSGAIGTGLSRLSVAAANLRTSVDAIKAAASRITDVDIAEESSHLAASRILQQTATAVLAQANQQPSLALTLLSVK